MSSQHCVSYIPPAGKNAGGTDCTQTIACLTAGSVPLSALAPGALPSGVTIDPAKMWDCAKTIACLTAGSIPLSALAPGALPAAVTVPLASLAPGALPAAITVPLASLAPGALPAAITVPTSSLTGTIAAANLPATTHTTLWDPVALTLTDTVNGITTVTSLGSLDDEGVTLGIVGGVLQLKNKAGTVIGSVPIVDQDAQTLSLPSVNPLLLDIAVSNGNKVTIDCKSIYNLFPADPTNAPAMTVGLLGDNCQKHTLKAIGAAIVTAFGLQVGTPSITSAVNPTTGAIVLSVNGIPQAPIVPVETQKLSLGGTATAPTITIGGAGNTIALPPYPAAAAVTCATIKAAYPAAAASPTVAANLLTDACTLVKMVRAVSSLGTPLNYFNIAA